VEDEDTAVKLEEIEAEEAGDDDDDEAAKEAGDDKPEPWMKDLNPQSLIDLKEVPMEESLKDAKPFDRFQFERTAFFVVDKYSKPGAMVFNRIVGLKESTHKPDKDARAEARSRKDEQAKQAAEKEAKKSLDPRAMFRGQTDLYSKFDEDGVPTHDAEGNPLLKSRVKTLRKEWEKQREQ